MCWFSVGCVSWALLRFPPQAFPSGYISLTVYDIQLSLSMCYSHPVILFRPTGFFGVVLLFVSRFSFSNCYNWVQNRLILSTLIAALFAWPLRSILTYRSAQTTNLGSIVDSDVCIQDAHDTVSTSTSSNTSSESPSISSDDLSSAKSSFFMFLLLLLLLFFFFFFFFF